MAVKKSPGRFIVVAEGYITGISYATEEAALARAERHLQERSYNSGTTAGVYELRATVKIKKAPVVIERVDVKSNPETPSKPAPVPVTRPRKPSRTI